MVIEKYYYFSSDKKNCTTEATHLDFLIGPLVATVPHFNRRKNLDGLPTPGIANQIMRPDTPLLAGAVDFH